MTVQQHVKNVDSFQRTSRWSLSEKTRTRESEETLIDRSSRPIRKLGKRRQEYAFAKGCHWFFELLLRLHTAAGFYVQGLKSTTVVAYRFCAYLSLSFRTVIRGGGVLLGILGAGVPTGFPILTLFKTRKCHFSHPFSDRAFKKLCHPSYLD